MPDLGLMQQALRRGDRERAEEKAQEFNEKGRLRDHFSVAVSGKKYEVAIPHIELTSKFNIDEHYTHRNDFLRAFAPLVGAVIMERYYEDYCKKNEESDFSKGMPLSFNPHFGSFWKNEIISPEEKGFGDFGSSLIQFGAGGGRVGFQVPLKTNTLYETTITKEKDKDKLFAFAKGYLKALHVQDTPYPQHNEEDYFRIDKVPHIKEACQALVKIAGNLQGQLYQELTDEEKPWYTAAEKITASQKAQKAEQDNIDTPKQEKQSFTLKIRNYFKL